MWVGIITNQILQLKKKKGIQEILTLRDLGGAHCSFQDTESEFKNLLNNNRPSSNIANTRLIHTDKIIQDL